MNYIRHPDFVFLIFPEDITKMKEDSELYDGICSDTESSVASSDPSLLAIVEAVKLERVIAAVKTERASSQPAVASEPAASELDQPATSKKTDTKKTDTKKEITVNLPPSETWLL